MTDIYISHLEYRLGSHVQSVDDAYAHSQTISSADDLKAAGFKQHCIASPQENAYTFAHSLVGKMGNEVSKSDAIIYATCLPENGNIMSRSTFDTSRDVKDVMDYPVSHLQDDFDIHDATLIGLNQQACTSMLGSLRIARGLMTAEPEMNQILCVTSDRFPESAIYEQAYSLISDGGAGCIVSRDTGDFTLLETHHISNGAMVRANDDETIGAYFNYTHQLITELLAKAQLSIDEIDWIVPQNTNATAWTVMSHLLKSDEEKVYAPTLSECGHVISGDNIINLRYLLDSGKCASGDKVLLVMAGYGMNWQGVILEKV